MSLEKGTIETFVFVTVPSHKCIALVAAPGSCTQVATDMPVVMVRLMNMV